MSKILIYSTPTVEGCPIEEYYGLVSANQVAGTGFFSDFAASFSDFFGGHSGVYRSQMNRLYDEVSDAISQKAIARGANAIVGARIDYDNISAKNMSMFMVSIQGTAVKLKANDTKRDQYSRDVISSEQLACEVSKKVYARKLQNGDVLREPDWKYVIEHDMPELASLILKSYLESMKSSVMQEEYQKFLPIYFTRIPYEIAVEAVYNPDYFNLDVICKCNLFNAEKILKLAQNKDTLDKAVLLLDVDKQSYNYEDLKQMKVLADYFQNLPDVGRKEEVKGGMFSSGGLKFICICGEKNNPDAEYCISCDRNIKGITRSQQRIINNYLEKVQTLEEMLSQSSL